MNALICNRRVGWVLLAGVLVLGAASSPAAWQPADGPAEAATRIAPPSADLPVQAAPARFWPELTGPTLAWFAVLVILMLTLQAKPWLSERNLDGLILSATCLLLLLRTDPTPLPGWAAGETTQWWAYLLLSLAAGYWLLRGLLSLTAGTPRPYRENVSGAAAFVLLLAGLAVSLEHLVHDPLTPAARDGLVGGIYLADTGHLPYGELEPHDRLSPCLYLFNAAAVRVLPPSTKLSPDGNDMPLRWANKAEWQDAPWWQAGNFTAARAVNGFLLAAMLVALYLIGRRLHSSTTGVAMAAIFCVFPGAVECLGRPEIMLPAVLMTWSFACALLPGVGGLLAAFLLVSAGTAWPWAWLALPVLLGYCFRDGWQGLGSIVGLAAGIVAVVAWLTWLTQPSLPREDAALARAGLPPVYQAESGPDQVLRISPRESGEAPAGGWLRPFWRFLVNSESLRLDTTGLSAPAARIYPAGDVDPAGLLFRKLHPAGPEVRAELNRRYRAALEREPVITRVWVALRTVLEQTWLARQPLPEPIVGTWALWSRAEDGGGSWPLIRKIVKLLVGLLSLVLGLMLLRRKQVQPVHLAGGLLVVAGGTLFASRTGAVANLGWLLPPALAVWAAGGRSPEAPAGQVTPQAVAERVAARLNHREQEPPPRITVES